MEKYCRARQVTGYNIVRRTARWIPKATNKHSEYVILIGFPMVTVVARARLNFFPPCLGIMSGLLPTGFPIKILGNSHLPYIIYAPANSYCVPGDQQLR